MVTVKRALLSCYDKTGLDTFAKALEELGVELVASGGTAEFLAARGISVKSVEVFAGITEQLDGRVKTLHPKIHAGILARRDQPAHVKAVGPNELIDLVVVNLYPFQQTVQRPGISLAEAIEQIDIGGVALLRAAAKNFPHVIAVSDPSQYTAVIEGLRIDNGRVSERISQTLAMIAFRCTSEYDTAIRDYLVQHSPEPSTQHDEPIIDAVLREVRLRELAGEVTSPSGPGQPLPESVSIVVRKRQALRYGENPHQLGSYYLPAAGALWGLATLRQLQGKALSHNNLLDIDAALRCLLDFEEPTCAIIKHNSQCGLASAHAIQQAYERAYECDPESAFGGVVGVNRPVDAALAGRLTETFLEVVLAPDISKEALAVFQRKANVRMVSVGWPTAPPDELEWRQVCGAWLAQRPDRQPESWETFKLATKRAPTAQEVADLHFAWRSVKHVHSNGITLAKDRATVGIGQGQPSRVGSVRLAIEHASTRSRGAVAASDGFFPFPDSLELLAQVGVTAVIQPGGSIRDAEVIATADAAKMAMLVTGIRHFRH